MDVALVVLGGSLRAEPAATQALAYVLNSSTDIAQAFIAMLRRAGIKFEPGHIQAELRHEDGVPDLTIHDTDGRVRILVENKCVCVVQLLPWSARLPERLQRLDHCCQYRHLFLALRHR